MGDERTGKGAAIVLWGAAGVLAAVIAALAMRPKPAPPAAAPGVKPVPVTVVTVQPRTVADRILLPGRLEPWADVEVPVEKAGRVAAVLADQGDRVAVGQILLRLASESWDPLLRQAEIESREAEKEFVRWQELQKTGAASMSDFDRVQKSRDLAESALAEARVHVSQCEVRSPIAGLVDTRFVDAGEFATEGKAVFRIVDIDRLTLAIDVPERDVSAVALGMRVPFRVSARPEQVFTGEVSFVSMAAREGVGTFRVEAAVGNASRFLRAGLIAEAELVRQWRENAIVVPLAAVVPSAGEHIVFVARDGVAERRPVRIDAMTGHEAVLSSGVQPGEKVVVEGQRALEDGTRLDEREAGGAT